MMDAAAATSVIVFGVGGVGSWCAEALVRSGIGAITIVDRDTVALSNINRQLPATTATVGRPKVEVLGRRLLEINPELHLRTVYDVYSPENADTYPLGDYDYVVDAIDSLTCKAHLILNATRSGATLVSSMGAARKLHASRIDVAEFWKVQGCPLARALRQWFKRHDMRPARKFKCVYSPEVIPQPYQDPEGANGTFAHTTAIAGLTLAGIIIEDLYRKNPPAS
ncbi:MAG: tRNA threonylcarbamoyladenosine dehydratase [Muribaculaceae bacterium]|nr:tRNA threonylcarbamoyladenosine dehydratase [Muribaculaceae bacterium]